MSCKKARGFLERYDSISVGEWINARKVKHDRASALRLAKSARTVVTGRGSSITSFDMAGDPPDDATLAAAILGPSGNLKAPTFKTGDTLVVGFSELVYRQILGESPAAKSRRRDQSGS
jgi:hypothetical protein